MSAGQFHINLETGDTGPCRAEKGGCPFGGDELHFTSDEAARHAYELIAAAEKAKSLQAWKKKAKPAVAPSYGGAPTNHGRTSYSSGHGYSGHGRS